MSEIKRFQFVECYPANGDPMYSEIKPDPEGAYVLYPDHLAALAERDAEIARLRSLLREAGEALAKRGEHGHDCASVKADGLDCTCGLDATLAKIRKKVGGG